MVSRLPDHVDRWHPMRAAFWARLHLHDSYELFRELLILARMGDHIGARIAAVRTDSAAYRPRSSTGARRLARFSRSGSPSAHESSSGGRAACVIANQNSRFAWFLNMVLLGDRDAWPCSALLGSGIPLILLRSWSSACGGAASCRAGSTMSNNTARSETRRCSSLLYERIRTRRRWSMTASINCNQLTTNSLPTGKFTGNFKAHSQLARAVPAPSSRRTRPAALQLGATA